MSDMTLRALLLGEDKSMSKSFKGAGKASESAAKDIGKSSKGIKGHISGLAGALHGDFSGITDSLVGGISKLGPYGAAAGAALGAVTAVAIPVAKESIDAFKDVAGETLKLQRIMGGTAEDASRMRFAFHETGVDADAGAKALGIFSKNLVAMGPKQKTVTHHVMEATGEWRKQTTIVKDAAGHYQKLEKMVPVMKMKTWTSTVQVANPVLAKLGITARDAHGNIRPMADLLPEIADKFKAMPNGAEKSALALKLFGKGGLALLPFLNRGAAGIAELKKKSDEFGLTLSGKDLSALKKSREAHKDWDAAMEGAKVQIGAQLLPMTTKMVTYFTTKMIPVIVKASHWVHDHGSQIQTVASLVGRFVVAMITVWLKWEKVIVTAGRVVGLIFQGLWNVFKTVVILILGGAALIESGFAAMLRALSHVPGFGWAKKAADGMQAAADQARGLMRAINGIPSNKTVTVNTYFKTHGDKGASAVGSGAGVKGYATGGRPAVGRLSIVGEHGPEWFVPDSAGTIYNRQQIAAMASTTGRSTGSSGGSSSDVIGTLEVIHKTEDGQVIERKLVALKRRRAGAKLAFI